MIEHLYVYRKSVYEYIGYHSMYIAKRIKLAAVHLECFHTAPVVTSTEYEIQIRALKSDPEVKLPCKTPIEGLLCASKPSNSLKSFPGILAR